MSEELIGKLKDGIKKIDNKEIKIYFFAQDTKGNPKASIRFLYEMAYCLKSKGYNVFILHDKKDYIGVGGWLGEKYMKELPHIAVDGSKLEISPEDIIIIPEIFGGIMEQIVKVNCTKIVLSQAYDHIFETLQPGVTWASIGFNKCITTTEEQKNHIKEVMKNVDVNVIQPIISDNFIKKNNLPKPMIGVFTRDQRVGINIIKEFYIRYPHFRWVTFRDLRGLSETKFSNAMDDLMLSVWVDPTSSFGTFPLESMKKEIPVLGLVPSFVPKWMNENNGIWVENQLMIVNAIGEYVQNWLEDNISETVYNAMRETVASLDTVTVFEENTIKYFEKIINNKRAMFEASLNKLTETINQ